MISNLSQLLLVRVLAQSADIKLTLPKTIVDSTGGSAVVKTATNLVFAFLALMAFGGLIYSGVMMITSGGDATKFATGRKNLIWSIIGIVVVTLAYTIIKLVYGLVSAPIK